MSSCSNKIYQAEVIRRKLNGGNPLSIEEIVKEKLKNCGAIMKKEDVSRYVCSKIRLPYDESISNAVSQALSNLESEGVIYHVSHGHWKINI